MAQKVIRIGSSAGITLSSSVLESLSLEVGDSIEVIAHPSTRVITVRAKSAHKDAVNPDVITWTNAFIDKNRKLLERLADT